MEPAEAENTGNAGGKGLPCLREDWDARSASSQQILQSVFHFIYFKHQYSRQGPILCDNTSVLRESSAIHRNFHTNCLHRDDASSPSTGVPTALP